MNVNVNVCVLYCWIYCFFRKSTSTRNLSYLGGAGGEQTKIEVNHWLYGINLWLNIYNFFSSDTLNLSFSTSTQNGEVAKCVKVCVCVCYFLVYLFVAITGCMNRFLGQKDTDSLRSAAHLSVSIQPKSIFIPFYSF